MRERSPSYVVHLSDIFVLERHDIVLEARDDRRDHVGCTSLQEALPQGRVADRHRT